MKSNSRADNKCIFCKYWIGNEPDINTRTGEANYSICRGMCEKDSSNSMHSSEDLCYEFRRSIVYL
ncbi:MAG: hypothetical protein E7254_10730 [Lachnospiraceae bacterium]|nr:hypothetical protein [Lachnospiraceae bacterium]